MNLRFICFIIFSTFISIGTSAQGRIKKEINDHWQFVLLEKAMEFTAIPPDAWQEVQIPHTWNNKDIQSGEKVHYGTAWYRRPLNIEKPRKDQQYFLRFKGVGQYAELYINGVFVGKHLGSYSAFVFNITDFINKKGNNTIYLKVNNELAASYPKDNFLFGIYGGIYRGVDLISTNAIHISLNDYAASGVFVHQENVSKTSAILNIEIKLSSKSDKKKKIKVRNALFSANNKLIKESFKDIVISLDEEVSIFSNIEIKSPHLWNGKKAPYLYHLTTELIADDKVIDRINTQVGIRYFSIDTKKGFILNGEPYRLYGVCRHQEWQDLGNALQAKHHRKDMELIDELGATSIRLAHYQQADYIYSLADSLGILVWAEIPFVNGYKKGADENALLQLRELIIQNYNHPSIFVWGLHNEVIKNKVIDEPVNLTIKLQKLAKQLDSSRYTVSVSNLCWLPNHPIHGLADLQGFNQYTGWYGGKPYELGKWIQNTHKKKPNMRISISEYGAGGNISHQNCDTTFVPNPLGDFFPETYQTYYHEQTYTAIEKAPYIWASYVWNMFDFSVPEWNRGGIKGRNHKGLVTYDRKNKKDAFYWYKANWSNEEVVWITGRRNQHRDSNICSITVYSNIGIPELFVNGKSYGLMHKGLNDVHFVSDKITFSKGKNNIKAKVGKNEDEYVFTID